MAVKRHRYTSTSAGIAGLRVLVVGHRPPITAVLKRLAIPFAVWHDKPLRRPPTCLSCVTHPFAARAGEIRRFAKEELAQFGPFTHVVAGTEGAVSAASVCRRALRARRSRHSIALTCSDKQKMKLLMRAHGVPMTEFLIQADASTPESVFARLGPKVVVKPRVNSGGRGLSIASSVRDIAARTERGLLYEKYVDANEMSIETFVHDGDIQFTSTTNYLVKTHANIVPANVPEQVLNTAQATNRRVIEALGLRWGLTHAEFYWTKESVLFGEVALRPPGGYIMDCISMAFGFDAWEAFVINELGLPYAFPRANSRTAGVALMHAGQGVVQSVENGDAASALPSCVRFRILDKPGARVAQRSSVSEVSAYGLFVSDAQAQTVADVARCLEMVRFKMAPA